MWFRRDLRLDDNPALTAAVASGAEVVPVFIWAPEEEGQFQPGKSSRWWLQRSLLALERQLLSLGSGLVCHRSHSSLEGLDALVKQVGADAVFFNHLYDPISLVRDNSIKTVLMQQGVHTESFGADLLYEPWELFNKEGKPHTKFEAFWDHVCQMPYDVPVPILPPAALPALSLAGWDPEKGGVSSFQFLSDVEKSSSESLEQNWEPGESGAMRTWQNFLHKKLRHYRRDKKTLGAPDQATSQLSPALHYGEISVKRMYHMVKHTEWQWMQVRKAAESRGPGPLGLASAAAAAGASAPAPAAGAGGGDGAGAGLDPQAAETGQQTEEGASVQAFLRQLGYREYGRYLSFHFPFTHERPMLEHLRACPWRYDHSLFKAWVQGATGVPIVDAAMQELWSTGWMHNRLRVVVSSYLVKNLLLPWQWGLKHFWDALLDADLECDALGWQYVSGCLADSDPFAKMLDLEAKSKEIDPRGVYVRRWLPMLARLPNQYIHSPHLAPKAILKHAGVDLGLSYPFPVVTAEESRQLVLDASAVMYRKQVGPPEGPWRAPSCHPASIPVAETVEVDQGFNDSDLKDGGSQGQPRHTRGAKGRGASLGGGSSDACNTGEAVENMMGIMNNPDLREKIEETGDTDESDPGETGPKKRQRTSMRVSQARAV